MTAREANQPKNQVGLNRYLSPLGAWALAFGCAVGWGVFVMPGILFLPEAGPLGTVLAMLIGAAIMILIGVNYYYMMQRYPDAGGAFTYTKKELGYDHGFLSASFLMLTYVSIIWANATALGCWAVDCGRVPCSLVFTIPLQVTTCISERCCCRWQPWP